jgi:hypothetical protein
MYLKFLWPPSWYFKTISVHASLQASSFKLNHAPSCDEPLFSPLVEIASQRRPVAFSHWVLTHPAVATFSPLLDNLFFSTTVHPPTQFYDTLCSIPFLHPPCSYSYTSPATYLV